MKYLNATKIILVSVFFCLFGCATSNMMKFKVTSTPSGAQVDMNGINMGNTPTEISLRCSKRWVGMIDSPDGWEYNNSVYDISVYPSSANPGFSQTKHINPCQWKGAEPGELNFNLGLQQVSPAQPINIKAETKVVSDDTPQANNNQDDILRNLKKLHDAGVLTDSEYKDKVVKVLDGPGNVIRN